MSRPHRPVAATVLIVLLVLLAIGAIPAGILFLLDTSGGNMGMNADALANSPFTSFLIPGLFLVCVLGLWSFVLAYGLVRTPHWPALDRLTAWTGEQWAWGFVILQGGALVIWIMVQVAIIGLNSFLQPFYFAYGLALIALCLPVGMRRYYALPTAESMEPTQ